VENEGVLSAGGPRELRHPRLEAAAGEVVRTRDVRLVAPLLIPSGGKQKSVPSLQIGEA